VGIDRKKKLEEGGEKRGLRKVSMVVSGGFGGEVQIAPSKRSMSGGEKDKNCQFNFARAMSSLG